MAKNNRKSHELHNHVLYWATQRSSRAEALLVKCSCIDRLLCEIKAIFSPVECDTITNSYFYDFFLDSDKNAMKRLAMEQTDIVNYWTERENKTKQYRSWAHSGTYSACSQIISLPLLKIHNASSPRSR